MRQERIRKTPRRRPRADAPAAPTTPATSKAAQTSKDADKVLARINVVLAVT